MGDAPQIKSGEFFPSQEKTAIKQTTTNTMEAFLKAMKTNYSMTANDLEFISKLWEAADTATGNELLRTSIVEFNDQSRSFQEHLTSSRLAAYKTAILYAMDISGNTDEAEESVFTLEAMMAEHMKDCPDFEPAECWVQKENPMSFNKFWKKRIAALKAGKPCLSEDYNAPHYDDYAEKEEPEALKSLTEAALDGDIIQYNKALKPVKKTTTAVAAIAASLAKKTPAKKEAKWISIAGEEYDLSDKEFNPRGFKKYETLTAGFFKTHQKFTIESEVTTHFAETKCCARLVRDGAGTLYPKVRIPFWATEEERDNNEACDTLFTIRFPVDLTGDAFIGDIKAAIERQAKTDRPYFDYIGFYTAFVRDNLALWEERQPEWRSKINMPEFEEVEVEECD